MAGATLDPPAGRGVPEATEVARWLLLIVAGAAATLPFFTGRLVGGTDARWYLYMLGDFLGQARAGHFPVFLGQGPFAWNGAAHPFRSAPIYLWVAGVGDWLTLRSLSAPALQHLTVVVSAVAGTLGFYAAGVALAPRRRWAAMGLALLYLGGPAWLSAIYCADAYMTYMAFAALPLVFYGNARSLLAADGRGYRELAVGLALVWMCHPPIAILASLNTVLLQWGAFVFGESSPARWRGAWRGALLFAALSAYYFISMSELPALGGSLRLAGLQLAGLGLTLAGVVRAVLQRRGWIWLALLAPGGLLLGLSSIPWLWWMVVVTVMVVVVVAAGRWLGFDPAQGTCQILLLCLLAAAGLVDAGLGSARLERALGSLQGLASNDGHALDFFRPMPLMDVPGHTSFQPGLGLWIVWAALGVAFFRARSPAVKMFFVAALLPVFAMVRVPWVSDFLVGYFPGNLAGTIAFPMDLRIVPVLSAVIAMGGVVWLAAAAPAGQRSKRVATLGVLAAALWAAVVAARFDVHGWQITATAEATRDNFRPENLVMDRFVYDLLPMPSYYSNGPMDPRLEFRLLDSHRDAYTDPDVVARNMETAGATRLRLTARQDPSSRQWLNLSPGLTLAPGEHVLLRFEFNPDRIYEGYLVFRSEHGYREYGLPDSGQSRAFGVGLDRSHVISLWNSGATPEHYQWVVTPGADGREGLEGFFATVVISRYADARNPVRLESLDPLRVTVNAVRSGWIETPRVFLPGYRATVDGSSAPLVRSPEGLVMVPLSPGRHRLTLNYRGTLPMWIGGVISAFAWAGWLGTVLRLRSPPAPSAPWVPTASADRITTPALPARVRRRRAAAREWLWLGFALAGVAWFDGWTLGTSGAAPAAIPLAGAFTGLAFAVAWWLETRRRYFPTMGAGWAALGVLAIGWCSAVPSALRQARPAEWAGYAFAMMALWAVARARRPWGWSRPWLAVAAGGAALAIGSEARFAAIGLHLAGLRGYYLPPSGWNGYFPFVVPPAGERIWLPLAVLAVATALGTRSQAGRKFDWGWMLAPLVATGATGWLFCGAAGPPTGGSMLVFQSALVLATLLALAPALAGGGWWPRIARWLAAAGVAAATAFNLLASMQAHEVLATRAPAEYARLADAANRWVWPWLRPEAAAVGDRELEMRWPPPGARMAGVSEPLLQVGPTGRDDVFSVRYDGAGRARLVYVHGTEGNAVGDWFTLPGSGVSRLRIAGAFLLPPVGHPWYGELSEAEQAIVKRDLRVTVDGRERFNRDVPSYDYSPGWQRWSSRASAIRVQPVDDQVAKALVAEHGAWRLRLNLPLGRFGRVEPLWQSGAPEAYDLLAIQYVDAGTVRLVAESSGAPAEWSDPIAVDYRRAHAIEIETPLATDGVRWAREGAIAGDFAPQGIRVRWDGRDVFAPGLAPHPTSGATVVIGANLLRAPLASTLYTGGLVIAPRQEPLRPVRYGRLECRLPDPGAVADERGVLARFERADGRTAALVWRRAEAGMQLGWAEAGATVWSQSFSPGPTSAVVGLRFTGPPSAGALASVGAATAEKASVEVRWDGAPRLLAPNDVVSSEPVRARAILPGCWSGSAFAADDGGPNPGLPTGAVALPGRIQVSFLLPAARSGADPILSAGRTGAADSIYLQEVGTGLYVLGLDHWSFGTVQTAPLALLDGEEQNLIIEMGSLFPPEDRVPPDWLRLVLNGKVVLETRQALYPVRPGEVVVGRNPLGMSTSGPEFRGRILYVRARQPPPAGVSDP